MFKAGDASYSLASGYVVYVYDADDDDWTAKTVAPTGRANTFDYIALFDTDDDGAYDIMIVAK